MAPRPSRAARSRRRPSRVLAVYAHPDDPEISAGGTLARWADAGADVHVLITTRGDKGSNDPDADTEALARTSRRGDRRRVARARRHSAPSRSSRRRARRRPRAPARARPPRPHRAARRRAAAPTRRRCSSATATSTTTITGSRVGPCSTRSRPAASNPHYFPELRDEGLDVHSVRPCTSRARSSPTRGSTSPRRSNARSRRSSVTRASSSRRGSGFASSCAIRPRPPGRAAGVTYAEAFRRLAVA